MPAELVEAVDAVVDILQRERVEVVFGIPGGPVMALYDRLAAHPTIRVVLVKHEQAAAYSAYAWARTTGRLGVCVATLGPGATNLLAGLPVAAIGSAPVLAITGQVQTSAWAHGAHQESTGWFGTPDQETMFRAVCKSTATCADARRLPDLLRHTIRIALEGRPGPAHLILPANVLHERIEYEALEPAQYRLVQDHACDPAAVAAVAGEIAAAQFPILLAGDRATGPGVGEALQRLAEEQSIPVVTDLAAKAVVDERSPLFLGCVGVLGHRAAERYLKEDADLVVAVGQSFDEISTLSWDPALGGDGRLIQLDVDALEIGKVFPARGAAVGHLPTILDRIGEELRVREVAGVERRRERVAELRRRLPLFQASEMESARVPLAPQRAIKELREALPDDAIVLVDSSKSARWLGRYFEAARGTIVTAHDYEPMGWAVAAAPAVKLAFPDRRVVCVSGDGAFLMSAMELSTAANHGLDVTWVILDDARLGIIYDLQKGLYGGRICATTFANPDFAGFAASFGLTGAVVERPGELAEAIRSGVAVVAVRIDADEIPPVRPRSLLITREMGLPDPKPGPETMKALLKMLKER